ncbi:uncharacterized protein LOC136063989 [Quercus suber]|uniref:uncharacterized protein LOC136063989 n=1 Tax=Quercus suber TaxID=58331 RepID=UPI0032DFB14C
MNVLSICDSKQNEERKSALRQKLKPSPLLPSRRTSTTATWIARAEQFRRRKSSRHALCFLLWGCAVLYLPKLPPHHTPKLTATKFVGVVCGAWKQTEAAMSHDPKFSLSLPQGGREAISKNLILHEDQLPQKFLHPKTKKKMNKQGDDIFTTDDFDRHVDKRAPPQPHVDRQPFFYF